MIVTPSCSFESLFQHGNANLTVRNFSYEIAPYFFGPPLIPIVPRFLLPPYRKYFYSSIWIYINSPTDTTIVDFSKGQLWYSEGKRLQLRSVEEWASQDSRNSKTEIPIGRTAIVNRKGSYKLRFEDIPRSAKELQLDFGNLEVNGDYVKVPVLKWRLATKYHYYPFYFD
jgi:hypothetical protein